MEPKSKDLRDLVTRLKKDLEKAEYNLKSYVVNCRHQWSDTEYDPIVEKAYTIPGDPPGTMGVDWRGPCYVPAKTTPRWKRLCDLCGTEEYTQRVDEKITKTPKFEKY